MILREAFNYEFSRLDPHGAHIDPPSVAVYETLAVKGPDWQGHPLLAADWETSEDGLEWRVRLRPGLRFHSGAPCDAPAVLRSLEALRRDAQPGRDLWYWDPVDTVAAADERILVFRLQHPYSRLPALLWGTHTAVYNEALRSQRADEFGRTIADGTGPFRLEFWSPERVVAGRWDAYPGAPAEFLRTGARRLDRIEWVAIPDENERLAALDRGEVDCVWAPPYAEVELLRADSRFVVVEHPQPSSMYLALDWRRVGLGFDDLRVRRAISLAIDRDELVTKGHAGRATAAFGPVPPGDEFYTDAADRSGLHEPALAAALLDEAGYAPGADGVRLAFECVIQDDQVFQRVGALVRDQLECIGVRLELRPVRPFVPFYDAVAPGPAASISKWLWQDPLDAIIGFSATANRPFPNWEHASVPELDEAYDAWLRAGPREELEAAAARVQRVFADTLPYVPLLTPNDVWVHRTHVREWTSFPANLYPFYQGVWIEGDGA